MAYHVKNIDFIFDLASWCFYVILRIFSLKKLTVGVESKKVSKNWTLVHPSFFQVVKTFSSGTFRYGPLNSVSVVGTANEEVGGYFPDFLTRLEANPFLQKVSVYYYYSYLLIEKVLPLNTWNCS